MELMNLHYYYYYNPEGVQKLNEKYMKSRYNLQSMLSTAGKLSCKMTALKHCTNIEILWPCKIVSLASPAFREILLIIIMAARQLAG